MGLLASPRRISRRPENLGFLVLGALLACLLQGNGRNLRAYNAPFEIVELVDKVGDDNEKTPIKPAEKTNLRYDPEAGFVSTDGNHVDRKVVIATAKSMLKGHFDRLFEVDSGSNSRIHRPVALINLHIQSNVGDSALMEAQLQVVRDLGVPQEMLLVNTTGPARQPKPDANTTKLLKEEINDKRGTVLIAGGGNMGTIYQMNQNYYNNVIKLVPNARVIHLPQSIVVEESKRERFNATQAEIYRQHNDVHVLMRDTSSYRLAKSLRMTPPDSGRTLLVPDLAFYLGDLSQLVHETTPVKTIAWMKRADGETTAQDQDPIKVVQDPKNSDVYGPMDWRGKYCPASGEFMEDRNKALATMATKEQYYQAEIKRGVHLLAQGQVVLTDRLHGQILSYLSGLPLIVMKDKTWKGRHFFETWTHVSSKDTKLVTHTDMHAAIAEGRTMVPEEDSRAMRGITTSVATTEPVPTLIPDKVTMVVLTAQSARWPDLDRITKAAATHDFVDKLIIMWNNPSDAAGISDIKRKVASLQHQNETAAKTAHAKTQLVFGPANTLNNRYNPTLLNITTEAVMIIDDDIYISPDTLPCLFESWKKDKLRIHSFGDPRVTSLSGYSAIGPKDSTGIAKANFLLPRMMFHRKYLDVYFADTNSQIRQYVDSQEAHCDDIAFSSVITQHYNGALMYVPAPHGERQGGEMKFYNLRKGEDNSLRLGRVNSQTLDVTGNFAKREQARLECTKAIVHMLGWTMPAVEESSCAYSTSR